MARNRPWCFVVSAVVSCAMIGSALAADREQINDLAAKGVAFLEKAQAADGSWSGETGPGITGIAATALLRSGVAPDDPVAAKAIAYLESQIHDDGGIYQEGSTHRNYETCVAITCFIEANNDGKYDELLKKAEAYLKKVQWDEDEGLNPSSINWGGAGYGHSSRPDLSNTAFFIDTMKALGRDAEDPAMQRALAFVSRCQNLPGEHNKTEVVKKNPDGGFFYTIAGEGASVAGKTPEGGLRSYGSMTYAGLKSMIYAGVGPDDPRVKAAKKWITDHYTLDENPQLAQSGLYYYYHTFAKALDAIGDDQLVDSKGVAHDWRDELVAQIAKRQKPDGSWVNSDGRFLETNSNLVTSYMLLTLSYVRDAAN